MTTVNQYVLFGIRLGFDEARGLIDAVHGESARDIEEKYHDNGYKYDIGHFEGMSFIADGMGGEYAFFGIIKTKMPTGEWLETFTVEPADPPETQLVVEKAKALFGQDFHRACAWHVLTHWQ